jgi:hypothetical protein
VRISRLVCAAAHIKREIVRGHCPEEDILADRLRNNPRTRNNGPERANRNAPDFQLCALGSKGTSISMPSRAMIVAGKTARDSRSRSDVSRE